MGETVDKRHQNLSSPNLLIVMPDQMRAQTLEFFGQEPTITPHLNKFSKDCLVFTESISNAPLCSPSRAMFLTGMYPVSTEVVTNCNSEFAPYNNELKEDAICWSDILNEKGYATGYIGKWHLDSPQEPYINCRNNAQPVKWNEWCSPERRHGFDYWYSYGTYNDHLKPLYWKKNARREEFHYIDKWGPEHEADLAIEYILNEFGTIRNAEKPFALVVSMSPPHLPYHLVPEKYKERYKSKESEIESFCKNNITPDQNSFWQGYFREHVRDQYAMITGVDEQFGRIVDTLKSCGLEKSTIVVFLSDHGDCLGIHGKKSKDNPFEESLRIPLMIKFPGIVPPRHDDLLISIPDIFPTLLSLLGFASSVPENVEGTDFSEFCRNGRGPYPESQFYFSLGFFSPKEKRLTPGTINFGERGIRTKRYTMVCDKQPDGNKEWYLWDRQTDPHEINNIAEECGELTKLLYDKYLVPWLIKLNDPWLEENE